MDTLYTVTAEDLDRGLRGIPVGHCVTSSVDPYKGLHYCDIPVSQLDSAQPEEVIYLLWHGVMPTAEQLDHFKGLLDDNAALPQGLVEHIYRLPRQGHAMKMLASALLIHAMLEPSSGDYAADALKVIARIPQICAHIINHHRGVNPHVMKLSLSEGYIDSFVAMLDINASDRLVEVMKLFNILHYDHGGGNLSCFTGKAIASGLEDIYGSLSGAMSALAGPRHGRANQDCLEQLIELKSLLGDELQSEDRLRLILEQRLDEGGLIYGFGHAVLRVEDPRATVQFDYALKHFSSNPFVQVACNLRSVAPKVLSCRPKVSCPYPNVDAISGTLLAAAGFDYPEYFTLLFGMSRIVGIAIQIVYERTQARAGKGTPIIRPKYLYAPRSH